MISFVAQAPVAEIKPAPQHTSKTRSISGCAPKQWRSLNE
jgi:hypothetical protein